MIRSAWGAIPQFGRALIALAIVIFPACGSSPAMEVPTDITGQFDLELERGREIYGRQCTVCHGNEGQGGRGKRLNEGRALVEYPEIAGMVAAVREGKGSGMPSFESKLEPLEIDAVVRYIREVLN